MTVGTLSYTLISPRPATMNPPSIKPAVTGAYKRVGPEEIPIAFDLYLPASASVASGALTLPTVVYFHGGGLAVGDQTWIPQWLHGAIL